ncbi:hypothetical protein LIPSTDRAFT_74157, partial [Lipomyces starkeyi NRRL Y-11557]
MDTLPDSDSFSDSLSTLRSSVVYGSKMVFGSKRLSFCSSIRILRGKTVQLGRDLV